VVGLLTQERLLHCLGQQVAQLQAQYEAEADQREHSAAALRASEQRYASLAAAVPVGIFRTDANGNCVYVNQRWCEIAGISPEAAAGQGWVQGLHPEDREAIATEWYQSAQEQRPFELEYRFQRPDGTVTWVFGQSVAERSPDGQIIGFVGTITDINAAKRSEAERQQVERALRQSEAQTSAILAAIPDLMFRVGADGVYRSYIKTNQFLDAIPMKLDPIGQHMTAVLPPDFAERQLYYLQQALQTGELQVYEQQFSFGDRLQYEEVRVSKSADDDVLFIIRDITQRKVAELEREAATAALEQLNQ